MHPDGKGAETMLRLHKTSNGLGRLCHFLLGHNAAFDGSLAYAMIEMIVQQQQCHGLQRGIRRGDLRKDVNTVFVVFHHLLNRAHLSLDAAKTGHDLCFVTAIPTHAFRPFFPRRLNTSNYIPYRGIGYTM